MALGLRQLEDSRAGTAGINSEHSGWSDRYASNIDFSIQESSVDLRDFAEFNDRGDCKVVYDIACSSLGIGSPDPVTICSR